MLIVRSACIKSIQYVRIRYITHVHHVQYILVQHYDWYSTAERFQLCLDKAGVRSNQWLTKMLPVVILTGWWYTGY